MCGRRGGPVVSQRGSSHNVANKRAGMHYFELPLYGFHENNNWELRKCEKSIERILRSCKTVTTSSARLISAVELSRIESETRDSDSKSIKKEKRLRSFFRKNDRAFCDSAYE